MLKPSTYKPHAIWFSRDPAFNAPPIPERSATATDAEWKATADAWLIEAAEWDRKVAQARETGVITDLLVEGAEPTLFQVRPMPSEVIHKLHDRMTSGKVGDLEGAAIAFRACVVGVSNLGEPRTLKMTNHPEYGRIEDGQLVQLLDEINPQIVAQLGGYLLGRAVSPNPK